MAAMRALAVLLAALLFSPLCAAQKWVDDQGKVYYGEKPKGVNVKPAPMTGGTTSTIGSGSSGKGAPPALPSAGQAEGKSSKAVPGEVRPGMKRREKKKKT